MRSPWMLFLKAREPILTVHNVISTITRSQHQRSTKLNLDRKWTKHRHQSPSDRSLHREGLWSSGREPERNLGIMEFPLLSWSSGPQMSYTSCGLYEVLGNQIPTLSPSPTWLKTEKKQRCRCQNQFLFGPLVEKSIPFL